MLVKTATLSLFVLALMGTAHAKGEYCEEANEKCTEITITNGALVNVTKVTVTQKSDDESCRTDKRKFSNALDMGGDQMKLWVLKTCAYKVKFKTTGGCAGDKSGKLTSKNMTNGRSEISLKGACGTLWVKTSKP